MSKRIVISASSDIGLALCRSWLSTGHKVYGTYRTASPEMDRLEFDGASLVRCELASTQSVGDAGQSLVTLAPGWDVLVLAPGTQEPVGLFEEISFSEWEQSILINFTRQMQLVHRLLRVRSRAAGIGPLVLFFAGGGTNNGTLNYSAYTVSKIALIKMTELLDAEVPDARFCILGPGWVRTKIHEATLRAGPRAGDNYRRTVEKLRSDELVPINKVVECCDWIVGAPRDVISGRNISLVYDMWGNPELDELLMGNRDMYKLRRSGNQALVRQGPVTER